jgi:hypothetical protein
MASAYSPSGRPVSGILSAQRPVASLAALAKIVDTLLGW